MTSTDSDSVVVGRGLGQDGERAGEAAALTHDRTDGTVPIPEISMQGTSPARSMVALAVKTAKGGTWDVRVLIGEIVGIGTAGVTLGPVIVTGAVTGSTFLADGSVGLVTVGSFADSRLFAGCIGRDTGTGAFTGAAAVGPFVVKGKADGVATSYVIATSFKNVTLASADTANGGTKFGFVYKTNLAGPSLKVGTVTKKYHKVLGGTQDIEGDLRVTKVV